MSKSDREIMEILEPSTSPAVPSHLQRPLSDRTVIDRGLLQLQLSEPNGGENPSDKAIARLKSELSAAKTPSERRMIRHRIKAIRRNPFKAALTVSPGDKGGPHADVG